VLIRVVLGVCLVVVHRESGKNFRQWFPSKMVIGLLSLVHPVLSAVVVHPVLSAVVVHPIDHGRKSSSIISRK
jgi:hypothetical protein